PLKKLGLIIIYDEENWSYKQEQAPFYHLRDVASMRAKLERSSLLLVSSAPSAEVWHEAEKRKILKVTCGSPAKNKVQIIDMAHLDSYQKMSLSFPLRNIIEKTIQAKGKAVLFLNRRGFSTMARCNQCGYTLRCQRCDINMTYLYAKKKMVCRLCQAQAELPAVCPKCNSSYLRYLGAGIEKLESELARIFPQARIGRFDKETAVVPRDTDIIIATQAVIKVLAQLSINLIAVLEFDSELQRLDFRATQVAFSSMMHLKQSAQDQLIIQTYNPDHYCLQAISRGDFSYFYREEIKSRRELGFPPFQHLIAIGLRGAREDEVFQEANELYSRLRELPLPHLDISDPQPDVVPKLRDKYRFTIMLKSKLIQKTLPLIKTVLKKVKKRNIVITMNVDP
ncbi:MAG: primosomal protein N', partial [Candidatus Omnitrophota bacterium]